MFVKDCSLNHMLGHTESTVESHKFKVLGTRHFISKYPELSVSLTGDLQS